MNTHDKYELPPLPDLPAYSSEVFDREVKVVSETMAEQLMHDYARAAIAPYQQRIEELETQFEAIGAGGVSSQRITSQRGGEPVARVNDDGFIVETGLGLAPGTLLYTAPQPAEPVRVPSDEELYDLAESMDAVIACNGAGDYNDNVDSVVNYARALLARYGQPVEPEEPTVRYCPGCGSIGPVESKYRNCCPDGNEARAIPQKLAEKCRDTFLMAIRLM